jgi:AcrR family transcriptional regulator
LSTSTGRPGRPAKVSLDDIVRAALRIGLDQATIRSVADELGMSVPGLYHHVRTRDQLLDLVAEWWLGQLLSKVKTGESFESLLLRYADKLFELSADHPQMIDRVRTGGGMTTHGVAPHLVQIVEHGVQCGFSPKEAFDIFTTVTGAALGAAIVDASTHAFVASSEAATEAPDASPNARMVQRSLADARLTLDATFAGLRAIHGERFHRASAGG